MFILSCPLQIAFLFSVCFAIMDIRNRTVSIWLFIAYFISGIAFTFFSKREVKDILFCMIPGISLLMLSFASEGGIGFGDAVFFILTSLFLNLSQILFIFVTSFLAAGILSLFLIIRGKTKPLPYLAFLPIPLLVLILKGTIVL